MADDLHTQQEYWDAIAPAARFSHPLNPAWLERFVRMDRKILDFGCGYGRILAELHAMGYTNLVGVDSSERMLSRARREVPHVELRRLRQLPLPYTSNSFDAALLFTVLTSVPDDNAQRKIIAECTRLLKSHGLLYISDLLLQDDIRNLSRYKHYQETHDGHFGLFELKEGVVMRHHDLDWLKELLQGF